MKINNRITPVGLKGQEINKRMKELMGVKPINENQSKVVVELTKMGPDGNAYAIIRENHEWYIKKSTKTSNLVAEDFKYIGGLMNKKDEAYNSYAKAIKHLNLKFKSLAEVYNFEGEINVFVNDNLLTENTPMAGGFSEMKGNGFTGEGNLEENKPMWEEEDKDKNNPWAICTSSVGREDKDKYEACVKDVKKKMGMDESMTEEGWAEECWMRENMTDEERAIDEMIDGYQSTDDNENQTSNDDAYGKAFNSMEEEGIDEEMTDKQKKFAALAPPYDNITYADKIAGAKKGETKESKFSISEGLKNIDQLIENFTEGLKKKV